MAKRLKILHQRLGQKQCWGIYYPDDHTIILDTRLKGKKYILYSIHEMLHAFRPDFSEEEVLSLSEKLANNLWKLKIRKLDE